jgi:uncharacterized membrane protein YfcA
MAELSIQSLVLLFGAAFLGGFVDSIAGGGGIITVPALLAVGLPPHLALGTNKLQAVFGSFTSAMNYRRSGMVRWRDLRLGIACTALGALLGTLAVQAISADLLTRAIPLLLLVIFLYMLCRPELGTTHQSHRIPPFLFYLVFGLLLGFYDGFFGPGTGSFWAIAFVVVLGFDLKKATAHTKMMNFTSNIVALIFFMIGGNVLLMAGLVMGIGQIAGAFLGSHLVLTRGTRFIRIFFLSVVAVTLTKLAWETYF